MAKLIPLFFILYMHTSFAGDKLIELFNIETPAKITYSTYTDPDDKTKKYYSVEEIVATDFEIQQIFYYCNKHARTKYMENPNGYWNMFSDKSEDKLFAIYYFLYKKINTINNIR